VKRLYCAGGVSISMKLRCFLIVLALVAALASPAAGQTIKAISPTNVNVSMSKISVIREPGRQLSTLTFTVSNDSTESLKSAQFTLFVFGPDGLPKHAETWTENASIPPRSKKTFKEPLGKFFGEFDSASLVLRSTASPTVTTRVQLDELTKAARNVAVTDALLPIQADSSVVVTPAAGNCPPGFCTEERQGCLAFCSAGGCRGSGFSCSLSACSSSCSCSCPPPPK
jgi:hypothetical protein